MASQDDPRLLYGKHVRKAVLADVKRDLENLSKAGKLGRLVSVAILLRNAVYAMKKQISLGWRE